MTVVAAEAAGGAAAAGGGGAAAGVNGGQAAGGGLAPSGAPEGAVRQPAAGPQGKTGAAGRPGKSGTPGKSAGGMFDKAANAEQVVDSGLNEARGLRLTPPKRLTVNDGAGFLGGLLLYVLFLNYLRFGKDGVTGWLGAKFVNRPWSPPDDSNADGSGYTGGARGNGEVQA